MLNNAKYIVVANHKSPRIERLFPFDPTITHRDMFLMVKRGGWDLPVSGGFVDEFMQCYGESASLRVSSRTEKDTKILKRMFAIDDKQIKFRKEDL